MRDTAYAQAHYHLSELPHAYGDNVHIIGDPFALTHLAKLCNENTHQPAFNEIVRVLYRHLMTSVVNHEFPRTQRRVSSRMSAVTPRGVFEGELLDDRTRVVCVDIARAGILPSQVCYDMCNALLDPALVRQDHLIMSRVTDDQDQVTGAAIAGNKIGGRIDDRIVLIPDPMGATGKSLATAISYYKKHHGERPKRLITLNLIVTPQFIRHLTAQHPNVVIYALRVDRGMSDGDVLSCGLGDRWDEENGLTPQDYIVPGGGGFGELMNNSYV